MGNKTSERKLFNTSLCFKTASKRRKRRAWLMIRNDLNAQQERFG
jgi:hypothetical protein